jgi:hypothetical protein
VDLWIPDQDFALQVLGLSFQDRGDFLVDAIGPAAATDPSRLD